MSDLQKEIKEALQAYNQRGDAQDIRIMQNNAPTWLLHQQELIEQLQEREFNHYPIAIHDLESRIFAQQDLIAQKDAEIARLQERLEHSKLTPMQKMSRSMDILSQMKGANI